MDYEQIAALVDNLGKFSILILFSVVARYAWRQWLQFFDRLIVAISLLSSRKQYEVAVLSRLDTYASCPQRRRYR